MAIGEGKYDDLATYVREAADADGVLVVVINGSKGEGFTVQGPPGLVERVPQLLRTIADGVESDLRRARKSTRGGN